MRAGAEFFTQPVGSAQLQYEAMRAYFIDEWPAVRVAAQFGYSIASVHQMATLVRAGRMRLFAAAKPGHKGPANATAALRDRIVSLRVGRRSVTEIARILTDEGTPISAQTVRKICEGEGAPRVRNGVASPRGPVTRLTTQLCGVRLSSPLMLASGGLGESPRTLRPYQRASVGAVVTRTLRVRGFEERRRFPSPHLHVGGGGVYMLNCEWGNQNGVAQWCEEGFAQAAARGTVIASVSGRDAEDCALVCSRLPADLVSLVEVNVSCSHSGELFGRVDSDLARVAAATRAAGGAFPRPPIVKLGWSPHVADVAEAAVEAGAGAIAVTNAIGPGLDLDVETALPVLGITGGFGGVSGPAILPIALQAVAKVAMRVTVPVVGIGGVSDWADAAKMILAGASAVGVYTAAYLAGPSVFDAAHRGLRAWLARQGVDELGQVRGAALEHLRAPTRYEAVVPTVDPERCRPCPACWRVCLSEAITLRPTARIDPSRCTGCGACVGVCPPERAAIGLPGWTGASRRG